MMALPAALQQRLYLLPLSCGIPWLAASSRHPAFAISLPDRLLLPEHTIRYLPLRQHRYLEGILLEFPLEAFNKHEQFSLSLLLAPEEQTYRRFLVELARCTYIELFTYGSQFAFQAQQRTRWPHMYCQFIQDLLRQPSPPRTLLSQWSVLTANWMQEIAAKSPHRLYGEYALRPTPPPPAHTSPPAKVSNTPSPTSEHSTPATPKPQTMPLPDPMNISPVPHKLQPSYPMPHVTRPTSWMPTKQLRKRITSSGQRAVLLLTDNITDPPRIYVKMPPETPFPSVALAFSSLNINEDTEGFVAALHIVFHLQERWMEVDCLFDPVGERGILRRLTSAPVLDVIALADTVHLELLGAKELPWPEQKRQQATELLRDMHSLKSRGTWRLAQEQFLQKHLQDQSFRRPQRPPADSLPEEDKESESIKPSVANNAGNNRKQLGQQKQQPASVTPSPSDEQSSSRVRTVSFVERCIANWRIAVREEAHRLQTLSPALFWRMMHSLALEQARTLLWTPEAAQEVTVRARALSEQPASEPSLSPASIQALTRSLAQWSSSGQIALEFANDWQTPMCPDTAMLFLYHPGARDLFPTFARQIPLSTRALTTLKREMYSQAASQLTLNVVSRAGVIVWSTSIEHNTVAPALSDGESNTPTAWRWTVPPWFRCPVGACHVPGSRSDTPPGPYIPCPLCQQARLFFSLWLLVAWQSLQGMLREPRLETADEEQREQKKRIESEIPGSSLDMERRYRVVRHIDIVASPPLPPTLWPRDGEETSMSWVDALKAIDPALVDYEEREIPLRTRTLRHPRFARYIAAHGTNQIEVKAHMRKVPIRSDPTAITRVTANRKRTDEQTYATQPSQENTNGAREETKNTGE